MIERSFAVPGDVEKTELLRRMAVMVTDRKALEGDAEGEALLEEVRALLKREGAADPFRLGDVVRAIAGGGEREVMLFDRWSGLIYFAGHPAETVPHGACEMVRPISDREHLLKVVATLRSRHPDTRVHMVQRIYGRHPQVLALLRERR